MAIRVLDAETIGQIAAGEVVERPASIVKELFENALDAGATSITVEVREGGISYLRVTDNGCGIAPNEVKLAFQNHATSKLRSADQLMDIRTMGFRGEALPSVAAVSKVECTTRQKGASSGVKLNIEGGEVISLNEAGCPEGTTIIVKDLFYNMPVRRTFLKKPAYESGVITEMVSRLLLANSDVAIRLISNGKTIFHSFGDGNLRHAAMAVYGRETASKLIEIDLAEGSLAIKGLIGIEDCARANRSQQSLFINGRVVRCPMIQQILEDAYKGRVTVGMHPMCMLSLILPSNAIDVNVHPNKLEVRFRDEAYVRITLEALFANTCKDDKLLNVNQVNEQASPVPISLEPIFTRKNSETDQRKQTEVLNEGHMRINKTSVCFNHKDQSMPSKRFSPTPSLREDSRSTEQLSLTDSWLASLKKEANEKKQTELYKSSIQPPHDIQQRITDTPSPVVIPVSENSAHKDEMASDKKNTPSFRIIGVVFQTYILVETEKNLLLIDQHAAHERILYEKYAKLLDAGNASQQLLSPIVLQVSQKEMQQIDEQKDLLQSSGFVIEPFGKREIAIRAVPFVLGKADLRPLFMEMLDRLDQLKHVTQEKRREELIQTACKHAVKAGDALTFSEISELIQTMLDTNAPSTCPHGRPVMRSFSVTELEKMFKRLQ